MNMNKSPDESLKQGRNRSWLLVKFAREVSENCVRIEWELKKNGKSQQKLSVTFPAMPNKKKFTNYDSPSTIMVL